MTRVQVVSAALCLAALHSSTALAAWQCSTLNKTDSESSATEQTVRTLCQGLGNALDFWKSGHEGHYAERERAPGYAKMTRLLCRDTAGTQAVGAVGALQKDNLELFCLDWALRGGGGNAVDALNAVLTEAGVNSKQVTWISSNDPNTQKFYKSLNVSCSCDSEGQPGKEVRFMKFVANPNKPIQKKEQHFTEGQQNYIHRILFDTCMSTDDFNTIATALVAQQRSVEREEFHRVKTNEPVLLSELITRGTLDVGTEPKRWLKAHPTKCE